MTLGVHALQGAAGRLRSAEHPGGRAGQQVDEQAVNASIERARQQTEIELQNTIRSAHLNRLKQNGLLTNP